MVDRVLAPKYEHCGQLIYDIQVDRVLTLTGTGAATVYKTGELIKKSMSLEITEVIQLRGARAAIVTGFPINGTGSLRKNAREKCVLVAEGSFVVWWN